MDELKQLAYQAKQRLKQGFWQDCRKDLDRKGLVAKSKGLNERKTKEALCTKVQSSIRGEKPDEFYLQVKALLDAEGEVSDAIGRLTDKDYFATLTYAERQRYTLELSAKYLQAVEKYKKEKQLTF